MYSYNASEIRTQRTHILCDPMLMEPKHRLRQARKAAGYSSPSEAARQIREINKNTLTSNENGNRPVSRQMAETYGRVFGVSPGWILYGDESEEHDETVNSTSTVKAIEPIDEAAINSQIQNLIERLSPSQKAAFLTMLQSFLSAIGVSENEIYGDQTGIEDKVFLGNEDGHLNSTLLEKASAIIRRQEQELTSQAIFNSTEYDRRLKVEYNKLYLEKFPSEKKPK